MVYIALVVVQVLFALNITASKQILFELDPVFWNFLRLVFSGGILLIFAILTRRHLYFFSGRDILFKVVPLSAIGYVIAPLCFLFGLKHTSILNAAIISTTIPLFTLILSISFKDEKLNLLRFFSFLCAGFGVYSLYQYRGEGFQEEMKLGNILILISCFSVASTFVLTKKVLKTKDHLWTTTYMFLLSIIGVGLFILLGDTSPDLLPLELEPVTVLAMIFSTVGGTVLAYLLNNWALSRLSSPDVSLFVYLQPVIAGLGGYFFFDEKISLTLINSSLLIFAGLVLARISRTAP